MSTIRIEALPYKDEGVVCLAFSASSSGFSGFAEILVSSRAVREFASRLTEFPANIDHTVTFEHGDDSGEFPYHLLLRAQVMDRSGHSAIFVRIRSFASPTEAALAEFLVPAEPAAINELGRTITGWLPNPDEPIVWQPRA